MDSVEAIAAAAGFNGQGLVLVLMTMISTAAMLWKTSRDQRHALDVMRLQHEVDAADRREKATTERAEREASAAQIRERLLTDATAIQTRVAEVASTVRDRVDVAAQHTETVKAELKDDNRMVMAIQTAELKAAIEAAKMFASQKADAAFDASNHANEKLRTLHEAHVRQGDVMNRLLEVLAAQGTASTGPSVPDEPIPARRATDPDGIIGRRSTDPPGVVVAVVAGRAA